MLKIKETEHSYYCSDTNFYVGNRSGEQYNCYVVRGWKIFKEEWLHGSNLDDDANCIFRFDINKASNDFKWFNIDVKQGEYILNLYVIQQRKGIFQSCNIVDVKEEDRGDIEKFLKERWKYLKSQWEEISNE